jgi:hypothetical protein
MPNNHLYVNSYGGVGLLLLLYVNSGGVDARSSLPAVALNSSISSLGQRPSSTSVSTPAVGGRIWLLEGRIRLDGGGRSPAADPASDAGCGAWMGSPGP